MRLATRVRDCVDANFNARLNCSVDGTIVPVDVYDSAFYFSNIDYLHILSTNDLNTLDDACLCLWLKKYVSEEQCFTWSVTGMDKVLWNGSVETKEGKKIKMNCSE